MVAILAVWFLVFLPSFTKRDRVRDAEDKVAQAILDRETSRLSEKAKSALVAKRSRLVWILLSLATFLVATLSVIELLSNGSGLVTTLLSAIGFVISIAFTVRSNFRYRNLVLGATSRHVPIQSAATKPEVAKLRTNTFIPSEIPSQKFLETGQIQIVELAEVHEIENTKPKNIESIDEIMRRRRQIG